MNQDSFFFKLLILNLNAIQLLQVPYQLRWVSVPPVTSLCPLVLSFTYQSHPGTLVSLHDADSWFQITGFRFLVSLPMIARQRPA